MNINEVIARINELAAKNKAEGLTEAELEERAKLRRIYIDNVTGRWTTPTSSVPTVPRKRSRRKSKRVPGLHGWLQPGVLFGSGVKGDVSK